MLQTVGSFNEFLLRPGAPEEAAVDDNAVKQGKGLETNISNK